MKFIYWTTLLSVTESLYCMVFCTPVLLTNCFCFIWEVISTVLKGFILCTRTYNNKCARTQYGPLPPLVRVVYSTLPNRSTCVVVCVPSHEQQRYRVVLLHDARCKMQRCRTILILCTPQRTLGWSNPNACKCRLAHVQYVNQDIADHHVVECTLPSSALPCFGALTLLEHSPCDHCHCVLQKPWWLARIRSCPHLDPVYRGSLFLGTAKLYS